MQKNERVFGYHFTINTEHDLFHLTTEFYNRLENDKKLPYECDYPNDNQIFDTFSFENPELKEEFIDFFILLLANHKIPSDTLIFFMSKSLFHVEESICKTLFKFIDNDTRMILLTKLLSNYEDEVFDSNVVGVEKIQQFVIDSLNCDFFNDIEKALVIQNVVLIRDWDYTYKNALITDNFEKEMLNTINDPWKVDKKLKIKLRGSTQRDKDISERFSFLCKKHLYNRIGNE